MSVSVLDVRYQKEKISVYNLDEPDLKLGTRKKQETKKNFSKV